MLLVVGMSYDGGFCTKVVDRRHKRCMVYWSLPIGYLGVHMNVRNRDDEQRPADLSQPYVCRRIDFPRCTKAQSEKKIEKNMSQSHN